MTEKNSRKAMDKYEVQVENNGEEWVSGKYLQTHSRTGRESRE